MNSILRIRNMALGFLGFPKEYKIKYYSPYDLVNSIKEETRWSPSLKLDFPDMDTLDIILFEVFPIGENFKSMSNDSTISEDKLSKEIKRGVMDDVKIFPNPNDGNFAILVEKANDAKAIHITDNLGKQIDSRFRVRKENQYNMTSFKSGVYFIEVVFEDKVIRNRIIIN